MLLRFCFPVVPPSSPALALAPAARISHASVPFPVVLHSTYLPVEAGRNTKITKSRRVLMLPALSFLFQVLCPALKRMFEMGAFDQTKTADHIFTKILPEMYIGIRKSSLQFGSHP